MTEAQGVILDASLLLAVPVALLAGLLSFFTPCSLPLVPGYLSYVAGMAGAEAASPTGPVGGARGTGGTDIAAPAVTPRRQRSRTVIGACLFVLGFAVVFTSYGALFGAVGARFIQHQDTIVRVAGGVTITFGVLFMGLAGRLPGLQRTVRPRVTPRVGLAGAPLLGAVFGIGWTPCIGPALAAVLTLATTTSTAGRGALLTMSYAIGLGIPFVLAAIFLTRSLQVFAWARARTVTLTRVGGLMLVGVGVLQVSGLWASLVASLQVVVAGWQAPL
ncbi:cytochrome c biogenesis protein CcdA [Nocardioides sp. ChNu-153]|uniref:cytochrome c biogenesis CcdA family protein n=1 Tax=unclassified Nocardioides TaxID=2615069 RepID=UPI002404D401|nr:MULTISPECIES: cytochrome c biogenesis protein CcdA [unclassified Nocardioides]MDF9714863.1 cytochrome c biogenesis protein CcdA [Nocardioides sp. ChNu-99]MDN7120011.1 cytochrome c biogenesis protein CcdA [Nocardioides sp. ChNu-153]